MTYIAAADRYEPMPYRRTGRSGLMLPGDLARPLEQLRRRPPARDEPRDRAPRVRSRDHALRPREQLRAAVRLRRGDVRPAARDRSRAVPRRARDLDQGRLRHVARAVRRVGIAEVPAREPRPEPPPHGARLRRHLLLAPPRSRDAARGDDGCARRGRPAGEGALRRDLVLRAGGDARGRSGPRRGWGRRC